MRIYTVTTWSTDRYRLVGQGWWTRLGGKPRQTGLESGGTESLELVKVNNVHNANRRKRILTHVAERSCGKNVSREKFVSMHAYGVGWSPSRRQAARKSSGHGLPGAGNSCSVRSGRAYPQGLPRRQCGVINLAARPAVWRLCGSPEGRTIGKVSLTAARPNVCATVALNHCGKIICERSRQPESGDDRVRVAGRCEAAPRRCGLAA
jgi:hypothetical protein